MHSETEHFLDSLFHPLVEQAAFLTFTAIHPDGKHPTPSRHVPLGDRAALKIALDDLFRANKRGWGAYIGIAPRRVNLGRWSRGKKADLVGLPALFVDLDDLESAQATLAQFPLPPSCLISSGRGLHAYWWLTSPVTAANLGLADRTLRGMAMHLGADQGMTIAQSMRLVGSVNTKAGSDGVLCHLLDLCSDRRYDFANFMPYLAPDTTSDHGQERTICLRKARMPLNHDLREQAIRGISQRLIQDYGGVTKRDGWLGALCPFGHVCDRPGQHFGFHIASGGARCFGRHGAIGLGSLCEQLGIDLPEMRRFYS
jgi:hypothetical protein